MARDADALRISKWAATGDVQTPEDRGLTRAIGWPADFATPGGRQPTREVFNQLFRELTALAHEINTRGLLDWDASVTYVHPALVREPLSGTIYTSAQGSTNRNPATDNGTYWVQFGATGWSPRLSVEEAGTRRVLRIVGWVGGIGSPPGSGQYIGPTGPVSTADAAANIGSALPSGGAAGQVMVKRSGTDFDMRWGDVISGYKVGGSGLQRQSVAMTIGADPLPDVWASAPADLLIVGWELDLAAGAFMAIDVAGTEMWRESRAANDPRGDLPFFFAYPIAVASGQRVSLDGTRSTQNSASVIYVNESDLQAITP